MEEQVPFQVRLDSTQHRRLKRLAERSGRSMGALVRESVAAYLADLSPEEDPLAGLIGMIEDTEPRPHGDVAEAHDEYLADVPEAEGATPVPGPAPAARRARRRG